MPTYLNDIPLPEAWDRLHALLKRIGMDRLLGKESIPINEFAVGRVLADPVFARLSSPHYHAAAMDGYALRTDDTAGASISNPITFPCWRSEADPGREPGVVYVDTGDPLPDWADAIIMVEQVEALDDQGKITIDLPQAQFIRIRTALPPWQNVRPMGEDMVVTQLVLPTGHILRPVDLGALVASGHSSVKVAYKPRVAILPTGSELVLPGNAVEKGEILESNSIILAGQVNQWGGNATRLPIVADDRDLIQEQVLRAAQEYDLILIGAGSSAGSEDFTSQVIEACGEVIVHGIALRPGHPVILGAVHQSSEPKRPGEEDKPLTAVPVIGIPGYPVSASLTGEIFVEPILALWTGREALKKDVLTAMITRKITSPAGDDDYLRVVVGKVGERMLAAPLSRGAGVISSLVRADGIVIIPRGSQGLANGDMVQVQLYRSRQALANTIFAIGSHDVGLDLLAQYLSRAGRRLVSANVGSMGGLIAIKRGEAHLAGTHLLDPVTGVYNQAYIREYLPGEKCHLVRFVQRSQGLLVKKGNPKQISSLMDLAKSRVKFINRQRGSGTRVLFDFHLQQEGISIQDITGYDQEEYTHLAVAAAIASGRADAGLGIEAAAYALELDFIPLYQEEYDLVIPSIHYEDVLLRPLFDILGDREFRAEVGRMPGYDTDQMGQLIAQFG